MASSCKKSYLYYIHILVILQLNNRCNPRFQFLINNLTETNFVDTKIMNMENTFGGAVRRFEEFVPSSGWTEDSDSYCLIIDLPEFKRDELKLQVYDHGRLVARGERQVNDYKHIRFEQFYKVPENSNIEDSTAKFEDEILYIVVPKKKTAENEPHNEIANIPGAVQQEKEHKHNSVDKVPEADQEAKEDNDQNLHAAANGGHEKESGSHQHSDEESREEEKEEHDDDDEEDEENEEEFHDAKMEKQRNEGRIMAKLGEELKMNKGILITAVLAFSLGVLVSQKFQPNEK